MNQKRVRQLNAHEYKNGEVVYWMQREHRVHDNWALLFAQEQAELHNVHLSVIFCLRPDFKDATERLISFMFEGLKEVEKNLTEKNITFTFLLGDPKDEVPKYIKSHEVGLLVTDFHSLRTERGWRESIAKNIQIPFFEVDARNIVPCWIASEKQEYGAYTLRPKIYRLLPSFLDEIPELKKQKNAKTHPIINWTDLAKKIKVNSDIKKLNWLQAGEKAAHDMLQSFIEERFSSYNALRNDPTQDAQSHLSPYLHFGHISAQRIVLVIQGIKELRNQTQSFLEELIVRRELSDNFCFYNTKYDSVEGFPEWARTTLKQHLHDPREYDYSFEELMNAKTHDELWNAAQTEALKKGIMHGYLRMYWAKKILEWSKTPEEALKKATRIMDLVFIDGREPNGFTGIAWAIGGVHDRAWFERKIFGKVRYMNFNGAKSKFNVYTYIENVNRFGDVK